MGRPDDTRDLKELDQSERSRYLSVNSGTDLEPDRAAWQCYY